MLSETTQSYRVNQTQNSKGTYTLSTIKVLLILNIIFSCPYSVIKNIINFKDKGNEVEDPVS